MPYENWAIRDFSAGVIDKVDDNLLPENAARDSQNFISTTLGSLKKRKGQARLNSTALEGPIQGLYAYYYGEGNINRRLVVASNGTVAYWTGSGFSNLKTELDPNAPVLFETCVNYMVAFNGVNPPWKWDGTTVSDLANAPPKGCYPVLHKEKLFAVNKDDPSTLVWSESFQPEEWPAVNYWNVKTGDGDEITALYKFIGELVIFKRRSIHSLRGVSLDDFRMDEIESSIGCVGPRAVVQHGLRLWFVADDGIYVFNGMRVDNITSERIPKVWQRINKEYLHKAAAGTWDEMVWFAVPEGDSTDNNMVIICSLQGDREVSFWIWRGINASCFQKFDDGNELIFYSGDSKEGYVNRQYVGEDDFGEPIEAYWIGKAFDMGAPEYEKKARKAYIEKSVWEHNAPELQISLDYKDFETPVLDREDSSLKRYRLDPRNRWRYITPKLIHDSLGSCEVRGIAIPYKLRRTPKIRVGEI